MNAAPCRSERRSGHASFQPSPLWERPGEDFPELADEHQAALRALPTPEPIDQELAE